MQAARISSQAAGQQLPYPSVMPGLGTAGLFSKDWNTQCGSLVALPSPMRTMRAMVRRPAGPSPSGPWCP